MFGVRFLLYACFYLFLLAENFNFFSWPYHATNKPYIVILYAQLVAPDFRTSTVVNLETPILPALAYGTGLATHHVIQ